MKKIYIDGCGGMLGEGFYRLLSGRYMLRCSDIDLNESWLSRVDVRNRDALRTDVLEFRPDYLFHLAALTDLEYCESNPADAYLTNALGVENAVCVANELNIPILYIGTAGIFDGAKEIYDDWDVPNPLGHYARAKLAGEQFVMQNAKQYLVCRAGWMMGGGPTKDKKFICKLMKQLKSGKKELLVVDDRLGTPTYTHDFARNVELLLGQELWGVYNMVCGGVTSRLEVAKVLVGLLGLEDQVRITEVSSDFFKGEYFAPRPPSERLLNRKLDLRGLNIMRDWKVALKEYLDTYYKDYLTS